jgi:DNA-binding response OmpR family regulator
MYKILVADDEENIRGMIREYAEFLGHEVTEAEDGMEAVSLCKENDFDIVVMDVMMPRMDGFTACKEIRKVKGTPVLMLSARGEEYDKLFGFEVGVDDYMVKPFSPKELMARINAILTRAAMNVANAPDAANMSHVTNAPDVANATNASGTPDIANVSNITNTPNIENTPVASTTSTPEDTRPGLLTIGHIQIDTPGRNVYVDNKKTTLTTKEFDLLLYLANNKNIVFTREQLLNAVWGYDFFGEDRTVDTHIKMLRNDLAPYRDYIVTLRGVGYKLEI